MEILFSLLCSGLCCLLSVVVVVGGGYFLWKQFGGKKSEPEPSTGPSATIGEDEGWSDAPEEAEQAPPTPSSDTFDEDDEMATVVAPPPPGVLDSEVPAAAPPPPPSAPPPLAEDDVTPATPKARPKRSLPPVVSGQTIIAFDDDEDF